MSEGETSSGLPGEFTDYKVKIIDVDMPKTGKNRDGDTEVCEVAFTVSRTNSKIKSFPSRTPLLTLHS